MALWWKYHFLEARENPKSLVFSENLRSACPTSQTSLTSAGPPRPPPSSLQPLSATAQPASSTPSPAPGVSDGWQTSSALPAVHRLSDNFRAPKPPSCTMSYFNIDFCELDTTNLFEKKAHDRNSNPSDSQTPQPEPKLMRRPFTSQHPTPPPSGIVAREVIDPAVDHMS